MHRSLSSRAALQRFFSSGFTASDIGEALVSFDAETPSSRVARIMEEDDFDVVGIRDGGVVVGFVRSEDLGGGACGDTIRYFGSDHLVDHDASLRQVVTLLDHHPQLFVKLLGDVGAIVTRADLLKPPVRMWLFGLVTIVEQAFGDTILSRWPDGSWREHLSEGRLALAERFQEERKRRSESLDLVDCLQFADKAHIVFKDPEVRAALEIESRSRAREIIRDVERLRNELAHSQDIVARSWKMIVGLATNTDRVLELYVK